MPLRFALDEEVRPRLSLWAYTLSHGWWKVGVVLFGLVSLYDLVGSQVPNLDLPVAEKAISWWDWKVWLILALVCALLGVLEGSYHYASKTRKDNSRLPDLRTDLADALDHVIVEPRQHRALMILRAYSGWPVNYPIRIRNCRPCDVELVGYNATILWDGAAVQRISWSAPSTETTTGLMVHPPMKAKEEIECLRIPMDELYTLDIPVNMTQVGNLPTESPTWNIRGILFFRGVDQDKKITYNLDTDNYQVPDREWEELRNHVLGGRSGS